MMPRSSSSARAARVPGIIGKFADKALQDFKPANPVSAFKTVRDTDWESVLGKQPAADDHERR